jgi:hypothetical protein
LMLLILFFKGLRELEEIPLEQWKFWILFYVL